MDIKPTELRRSLCLLFQVKSFAFYPNIIWNSQTERELFRFVNQGDQTTGLYITREEYWSHSNVSAIITIHSTAEQLETFMHVCMRVCVYRHTCIHSNRIYLTKSLGKLISYCLITKLMSTCYFSDPDTISESFSKRNIGLFTDTCFSTILQIYTKLYGVQLHCICGWAWQSASQEDFAWMK